MLAAGVAPFTTAAILEPAKFELEVRREIARTSRERGTTLTDEQANTVAARAVRTPVAIPHAVETFDVASVESIPAIVGDDVARYCYGLPDGTLIDDVVSSLAPPFDRFWVEFQRAPARYYENLHGWGVLVESSDEAPDPFVDDDGVPRWTLRLSIFLEPKKGTIMGPTYSFVAGLAEDGTFFRHHDGDLWWGGGFPKMTVTPPDGENLDYAAQAIHLVLPALLTISFMHCKNVRIETVEPSLKLSRKYEKRHGRPLVRYQTLDVEPMKQILDRHGATSVGLRQALHICRGHFKVFTQDAPLFGRHTGTYWWAPQVRGDSTLGVTINDYRIHPPAKLGHAYVDADEDVDPHRSIGAPGDIPDSTRRGAAAHARTQNLIAEAVRSGGLDPRSPASEEPPYDLAWLSGDITFVCEVKSITDANEEIQMRLALGQILRYCQILNASGLLTQPVIAVERGLNDEMWPELLKHEGIVLIWPEVATERILAAAGPIELG